MNQIQCPNQRSLYSVILYVEVTGLAILCDRLGAKGDEGLEGLSRSVNACIEFLTNKVTSSGAEVIKFNGDGFLILWTPPDYALGQSKDHTTSEQILKRLCVGFGYDRSMPCSHL